MGGIIGKLSFEHDQRLARPVLEQMLGALRHRGSAGNGLHVGPGIALGWCGNEPAPITRPAVSIGTDDCVRVVADAALTNAGRLRRALEHRGHVLRGRTDADLIAHAYEEWGDACVEHLQGPFACAIWDGRGERLLLARDAFGIRPLFFAMLHGHGLVFASEIRALLHEPGVGREWCPQAIDAYLALGYIPAPLTAYQRISKVEPAQRLIVQGRRLHVEQYWSLPSANPSADEEQIVTELDDRLRVVVAAEFEDAQTGLLYSGGRASSALLSTVPTPRSPVVIVALADAVADVARSHTAAAHLGFDPHVEMAAPDVSAIAQRLATHLDEPLADPAAISQYATFTAARLHIRRAVTGHGAAALWPERISGGRVRTRSHMWHGEYRRELYTRKFAWEVRESDPFARYLEPNAVPPSTMPLFAELHGRLADDTLAVAERASVAAGVQLRFPFLEPELIALATKARNAALRSGDSDPLRRLVGRRLPASLRPAPVSRGSQHPWLPGAVAALVPRMLLGQRFDGRGIISRPALQRVWDEHATGRRDHAHRLWSLLMLDFWFREFIDGDAAADAPMEYALLRAA